MLADDILTGNIKEIPREGSLLPDTYNFTRGISREQIIQRMQAAQQRLLKESGTGTRPIFRSRRRSNSWSWRP